MMALNKNTNSHLMPPILVFSEITDETQVKKIEKSVEKLGVDKTILLVLKCPEECSLKYEHYSLAKNGNSSIGKCILLGNADNSPGSLTLAGGLKIAYVATTSASDAAETSKMDDQLQIQDQVDILLTDDWPADITRKSALATSMDISPSTAVYTQSQFINKLVLKCRPRYHFAFGGSKRFFEREPFTISNLNADSTITRFIGLASPSSTASDKKEKSMYAFNLAPKNEAAPPKGVVTSCPFHIEKRPAEDDFHQESFFWNDKSVKRIKKEDVDGVPPDGYLCKICQTPGHYVHKCPQNKKEMPDGYICRICGIQGHFIRDCPKAGDGKPAISKSLKKRDLSQCWFCLSNPQVESHMILGIVSDCYVALAKGALTDEHVLVVPVVHHASSSLLLKSEAETAGESSAMHEVTSIYRKMNAVQKERGNGLVYFEVFGGGDPSNPSVRVSHMHVNYIPLPLSMIPKVHEEFAQLAQSAGLVESENVPDNIAWPFVRVGVEGWEKVYSPPPPRPGRPLAPFDLSFARGVVAGMLGLSERRNWKTCVKEPEEEGEITDILRQVYSFLVEEEDE